MSSPSFCVEESHGELHFNAGHSITVGGTCENLHGHNFHLRLSAEGSNIRDGFVMDFVLLNRLAAEVCLELHNKVLIPGRSDEFSGSENEGQIQVESHGRRFVLPAENCAVLPVSNTTAEMLAWHILERLLPRLEAQSALSDVRVIQAAVEEADRQWGLCRRELGVGGRPAHG